MKFRWMAVLGGALITLAAPGASGLRAATPAPITATDKPVVAIDLIDFDPAVGDVHARLHLILPASMLGPNATPRHDLTFVDAATVDESILKIPSTNPFSYYDAFVNARYQVGDPGSEFSYPFDVHETAIDFFLAQATAGGKLERVPITYDCSGCSFDGFKLTITDAGSTPTEVRLRVRIRRSTPIITFSVFLAVAMWAMTILVLVLAIRVAHKRKKAPEVGTMGFIGGLLFAYPAIRGSQPRVPPMGVLSDYYGFFWNELILIIALVWVMVAWVRFPEEPEDAAK